MKLTFKPKSPEDLKGFYAAREDEQVFEYFMQFCETHGVRWVGSKDGARCYKYGQAVHLDRGGPSQSSLRYANQKECHRITLSDLFYTVEEFLAAGYKIKGGDVILGLINESHVVEACDVQLCCGVGDGGCNRYVLSASALMGDSSDDKGCDDKMYSAPLIGEPVFISKKGYELSEHGLTFIGKEVRVAGYFTTQPNDDEAEPVKMVAVSKRDGDSCCFRLDMIETPGQKAARERDEKKSCAFAEIGDRGWSGSVVEDIIGAMIDAGYRKEK